MQRACPLHTPCDENTRESTLSNRWIRTDLIIIVNSAKLSQLNLGIGHGERNKCVPEVSSVMRRGSKSTLKVPSLLKKMNYKGIYYFSKLEGQPQNKQQKL